MKKLHRVLSLLLVLTLLCSVLPFRTHAAGTPVIGTVYSSSLSDKAELILSGDTILVVDTDKTLKSISGSHALTIRGDGQTTNSLVIDSGGHGISVSSVDISSCILVIGSKRDGLNIDRNVIMNSGLLAIDAGKDGIYSRNGSVIINGGVVESDCGTNCAAISTEKGSVSVNGGNVTARGAKYGIYAGGSVNLKGTVTTRASGWAIYTKTDINVSGGKIVARAGAAVVAGGRVTINGDFEAEATMDNAPALAADGGIRIEGGNVLADCTTNGDAIRSSGGNIVVTGGTVTANGAEYAIYAPKGNVQLKGNVTAKASGYAIRSSNGISVTGGKTFARAGAAMITGGKIIISADVEAKATMTNAPAMSAAEGIEINSGIVWATCSSNGDAIYSASGSIKINGGIVTAAGSDNGIFAHDGRVVLNAPVIATGDHAVRSGNGVSVPSPYTILVPTGGTVSGNEIVDQKGNSAVCVQISIPPLTGAVHLSGITAAPGAQLSYSLSGMVSELSESKLHYQWQQSSNGESDWMDLTGATGKYHVVELTDVDRYLRVKITADGYDGMVCSAARLCVKWPCATGVVSPILDVSNNQVRVMNPQSNQEYIIFSSKKDISSLTESDWANSKTWNGSDTIFYLGGTANTVNYVYTRVRETAGYYAGKAIGWQCLYLGTTTAVQEISIQPMLMVFSDGSWTAQALETAEHNFYYAKLNDVIRITATPTPANATFSGIQGSQWLVRGNAVSSQYGKYYTTPECSELISRDQYYRTVYFRPENTMINGMELRASYTRGYNDVASDAFTVNVGNKLGVYKLEYVQFPIVSIEMGDTLQDIAIETHPDRATIEGSTATLTSGTGTAPIVTIDGSTFSVNAADADPGDYYYKVLQNGSEIGGISVHVTAPPVEEVHLIPETLTGEPGESFPLVLQCFPYGSSGEVLWTSSNPSAATVSDGVVAIAPSAEVAESAIITATVNGHKAECKITVAGEKYALLVDGVRVTSRNQEDILGNGVFSFDGFRTLRIKGDYSSDDRIIYNEGVDGLVILTEKNSVLSCSTMTEPINVKADTILTGPGQLTLTGGDSGVFVQVSGVTLTIRDTTLDVSGRWGVCGPNGPNEAKLVVNHASVTAASENGAVCDFGGGITMIDSELVLPEDGRISDNGRNIVDGTDVIAKNVQIDAIVYSNPFADVDEGAYYYDAVLWAVNREPQITNGIDASHFAPDNTCTRGQVVTFLWRAAGSPEPGGTNNPFKDVKSDAYYYKAVLWAVEQNITNGTGATTFSPDQGCTRGQVVTFLHRFAGTPAPGSTEHPFKDVKTGAYYYEAVLWAVAQGVTNGTSATTFSPDKTCTRGQIVTFLYRAMRNG